MAPWKGSAVRLRNLIVLTVAPLLLSAALAGTGYAAEPDTGGACSRVYFIGVRGSGESYFPDQFGMGGTVHRTFESFAGPVRAAGVEVVPIGITYPAAPVQELIGDHIITGQYPSVTDGETALAAQLTEITARRDGSCVVLAGYSQGAWVIGNIANKLPLARAGVVGITLFGDPRFDPRVEQVAVGSRASAGLVRVGTLTTPGVDDPYFAGLADRTRSYCHADDPVCNFVNTDDALRKCGPSPFQYALCKHLWYIPGADDGYTDPAARFLIDQVLGGGIRAPRIDAVQTYQEGPLVFAGVSFSDPDGNAAGFGFRGVNGAGWAEESHPFDSPSYGRVTPGRIDYPFNHACGTDRQYRSDVEFWIYDGTGARSASTVVQLACSG